MNSQESTSPPRWRSSQVCARGSALRLSQVIPSFSPTNRRLSPCSPFSETSAGPAVSSATASPQASINACQATHHEEPHPSPIVHGRHRLRPRPLEDGCLPQTPGGARELPPAVRRSLRRETAHLLRYG